MRPTCSNRRLARGELRVHRRDDARRIPPAHREGRRARAQVSAGVRGRADGRRHGRDSARSQRSIRAAPQGQDQGFGDRHRGEAGIAVHHRSVLAGQGDRPGRRGGQQAVDGAAIGPDRDRRVAAAAASASARRAHAARGGRRTCPRAAARRAGRDRRRWRKSFRTCGGSGRSRNRAWAIFKRCASGWRR